MTDKLLQPYDYAFMLGRACYRERITQNPLQHSDTVDPYGKTGHRAELHEAWSLGYDYEELHRGR